MIKKEEVFKEIRGLFFSILGALVIVLLLNIKVFASVKVQHTSMENTLHENEQLIIDKLTYNFSNPKRGDIIIFFKDAHKDSISSEANIIIKDFKSTFNHGESNLRYVKRVIGVPGDEINIKDGYVYVNGEKLEELYIRGNTLPGEINLPIKIPNNELFVLGDNRPVSIDSRVLGLINYNQIDGKVVFRVYPFNKAGNVK